MAVLFCSLGFLLLSSFRKEELALQADRPVGAVARRGDVVEGLHGEVDRQLARVDDFAEAAVEGHRPHVAR